MNLYKDTESHIYCLGCLYTHKKSYKISESNNIVLSLFYGEK